MLFPRKSQLENRMREPDPFICAFRRISSLFSVHELNHRRSRYVSVVAQTKNLCRHINWFPDQTGNPRRYNPKGTCTPGWEPLIYTDLAVLASRRRNGALSVNMSVDCCSFCYSCSCVAFATRFQIKQIYSIFWRFFII